MMIAETVIIFLVCFVVGFLVAEWTKRLAAARARPRRADPLGEDDGCPHAWEPWEVLMPVQREWGPASDKYPKAAYKVLQRECSICRMIDVKRVRIG